MKKLRIFFILKYNTNELYLENFITRTDPTVHISRTTRFDVDDVDMFTVAIRYAQTDTTCTLL